MALRNWLRRLEKSAHGETYVISQKDGPPKIFPKSEYQAAWENAWRQMSAGEDAPPMHPMITAALNSSDPEWRRYFLFCDDLDWTEPIEDTSEP
jgi:hypothetical protein